MKDYPIIRFDTEADWQHWLDTNHGEADGVWLQIAKKNADAETVTYGQALNVALCFGWIDGQKKQFDASYWLQKFTPRRKNSKWSKRNVGLANALIQEGKMRESGQAEIDAAKADGRWKAAYDGQSMARVPDDLQAALDKNPAAHIFFNQLDSRNRYAILYRIQDAKRQATRKKRIAQTIEMLNEGKKLYE